MKRFISTMFALFLMIVLLPTAARAKTLESSDFDAQGRLTNGDYELTANFTATKDISVTEGNTVKIDLNGHELDLGSYTLLANGVLEITDSSTDKSGTIKGGNISVGKVLKAHGGTVSSRVSLSAGWMSSISVNSGETATTFTGSVTNDGTISGGTFSGTVTNKRDIRNGTFNGKVINGQGWSNIYGGTFNGEVHSYGYATISGGKFHGTVTLGKTMVKNEDVGVNSGAPGYYGSTVSGGDFYGQVKTGENTTDAGNTVKINKISGGWFFKNVPEVSDELQYSEYLHTVVKITYKSKNGAFFAMNVKSYDPNDGTGVAPDYSYIPDGKSENDFDCWYKDEACSGTQYTKESESMELADLILYGKAKNDDKEEEDPWDNPFIDVHEYDWFYDTVKYCHKRGWFKGKTPTIFAPYDTFTRAEISAVLYNRAGQPAVNVNRTLYDDVEQGAWYTRAIYWMTDQGNAAGAGGNKFYPANPVTREELATMLYNAAGRPETNGTLFQYLDEATASEWALPALRWAVEKGIMIGNGDGTLNPTGYTTRAEATAILRNFGRAGY